jgi:sulfur-oxidizing protein SoxA
LALVTSVFAGPEEDRKAFRNYYQSRFPDVELAEYINGIYALDEDARQQWMEIEEFPPYEFAIEVGEILFGTAFENGKGYSGCFENQGIGIRQNYPQFMPEHGEVITLELAINQCRERNAEEPYAYDSEEMLSLSAYMAYTSRGKILDHLGPSLGHPTHFPVYRSKFGRMISLHSRFYGCIRDVRARPFEEQSSEYRNLEYFLTYMSNGLEANGPGARK